MTDYIKYRDAINDPKIVMKFGSSVFGRYIINPYNGNIIDLLKERKNALCSEKNNPNVLKFIEFMNEYPSGPVEYYLEVPFRNQDVGQFYNIYHYKFLGEDPSLKRASFRSDVYFPDYGSTIELDSGTYHGKPQIPLDETKENILFHNFGIPTALRLNLTSDRKWEITRAKKALYNYLDSAEKVSPIIDAPGIIESWNVYNRDLLVYFPYIESVIGDYYAPRKDLYSFREVTIDISKLPPDIGMKLELAHISTPLKAMYKRIKNIDLRIIKT